MGALEAGVFCGVLHRDGVISEAVKDLADEASRLVALTAPSRRVACSEWARPLCLIAACLLDRWVCCNTTQKQARSRRKREGMKEGGSADGDDGGREEGRESW